MNDYCMTNEEAIEEIRSCLGVNNIIMPYSDEMVAFGMAIEALQKVDEYRWHDLRKNPDDLPPTETEVDIVCENKHRRTRTHGIYENGKVHTEDSEWWWDEIYCYGTYCEETDDYIIPEGWWEYRHYAPDEAYNHVIDDKVIAWREIEPFDGEK